MKTTLTRIDFRIIPIIFTLMVISLAVIASMTSTDDTSFWTPLVKSQLRWFLLGWVIFFFTASLDYRMFKDWSAPLYIFTILLLLGLFFVSPIQNVHRWYRIPGLASFQPSEQAKFIMVIFLSWFLEKKGN